MLNKVHSKSLNKYAQLNKVSCFYSATHAEQRKGLRHSGEEDTGNSLVLYCFDPHWLVSLHTCSGDKGTKPKDSAGLFYL